MPELVKYVGDPFVDTGVAVLEHQLAKSCEEFSEDDLISEGAKLTEIYSQKQWRGILTFHFPNSGWTNPTMGADKVAEFRTKVLEGFRREASTGRVCEYCQRPAQIIADGSIIPLISNAGSMECGSGGRTGFPICGFCLFAIQFYPLATLKVEGKALFWWSQDKEWTYLMSGIAIREVRRFLAASPEGDIKPRFPRSRLFSVAREAFETWRSQPDIPLRDIIGCHSSNYRTSPEFEELRIPRELLQFWYEAAAGFGSIYDSVVSSAWDSTVRKGNTTKKPKKDSENEWVRRNGFYEALGAAFQSEDFRYEACAVAGKYFIRIDKATLRPGNFDLACLFLERLASMKKSTVEAIKEIGDRIAASSAKKKILERLIVTRNPVGTLANAQIRMQKDKNVPLRLDTVLAAFGLSSEDDSPTREFWLARDLIVLRILEQVDSDTLAELPELAPELEPAEKGEN